MKKEIRKNVYSIIVILLFILSIGFATATFHLLGVLEKENQTYIGSIAISNYEESQYENIISGALLDWEDYADYKISYQNIELDIDFDYFEADVATTISQIQINTINSLVFNISEANKTLFTQELSNSFSVNIISQIDTNALISDIMENLETMSMINSYDLKDYFSEESQSTILNTYTIINLDSIDVDYISNNVTSFELKEKSRFNLLEETIGLSFTNNQLSIIASGIQALSMNSNLSSYIFEQNNQLPTWGLEGLNVRILQANHYDFSLFNNFNYSMHINLIKNDNNSITFELIGYPFTSEYSTVNTEVTEILFDTVYESNDIIDNTTPEIITTETDEDYIYQLLTQAGINGKIVKFERTITYPDGSNEKVILYYEEYQSTSEIYQENIIPKGGE